MSFINKLNFTDGLIPAVIQDARSKKVLTLCYMDRKALAKTLKEKMIYVFRRSKGRVMLKGEMSGCVQKVRGVFADCEGNSLLFIVNQKRAACHAGYFTCYFRELGRGGRLIARGKRVFDPGKVYKK